MRPASLASAEVNLSNSVVSNNGLGVGNLGGTVTIRLANNDIAFNTTGFSGATQSYFNNRLQGNGVARPSPDGDRLNLEPHRSAVDATWSRVGRLCQSARTNLMEENVGARAGVHRDSIASNWSSRSFMALRKS